MIIGRKNTNKLSDQLVFVMNHIVLNVFMVFTIFFTSRVVSDVLMTLVCCADLLLYMSNPKMERAIYLKRSLFIEIDKIEKKLNKFMVIQISRTQTDKASVKAKKKRQHLFGTLNKSCCFVVFMTLQCHMKSIPMYDH